MDIITLLYSVQLAKILISILVGFVLYALTNQKSMWFLGQLLIWLALPILVSFGFAGAFNVTLDWFIKYVFGAVAWFGLGLLVFKKSREPVLVAITQVIIGLIFI